MEGGRLVAAPGAAFQDLFGAPAADGSEGGERGKVEFHDGWYVPDAGGMFRRDVLTVHQRGSYAGGAEPNDHEAPNPVSFLTVRPGARFYIALSLRGEGDEALLDRAERLLLEAVELWGLGGKTAANCGRLRAIQ